MAIIIDPDDLGTGSANVVVNTTAKTIQILTTGVVSDAGAEGGVTGQCLYSWLKERWSANPDFIKFPFPMEAITPEQFEFINGWVPFDDATRGLIRTAGWTEKTAGGAIVRQYSGVVSLGSLGETDQPYYQFGTGAATNFLYPGPVNEAVQIYGDIDNGDFDHKTAGFQYFKLFCREEGKTYADSNNSAIGAPTLTYIVYRFPLSNGADLNILDDNGDPVTDAIIAVTAPWTAVSIEYFTTDQMFDIDGDGPAPFRVIVDGASVATTKQIYQKIQYQLRQNSDIDSGLETVIGKTAEVLLVFVGDTLVTSNGVFIDNLEENFLNSVDFYDFNGVLKRYPFTAAGNINFGANAGSGDFKYWMFFNATPLGNYGTADAIIVQNASAVPIEGTYTGGPVTWSFAYDSNTQGNRTAGTNALVKVVGIGLDGGQFIVVDYEITKTQGQNILLAPAQERNYVNPV